MHKQQLQHDEQFASTRLFRQTLRDGVVCLYIDGEFRLARDDGRFTTFDPATESQLAHVALACFTDVDQAVQAARQAFDAGPWPRMKAAERASFLFAIADQLEGELESLARLETRDTGLPITFTQGGHIPKAIAQFRYYAEEAVRLAGEAYTLNDAYLNVVFREPIGVAGILTPWNAPLAVAASNVSAALAVGNCCVLKPSEEASLTAAALAAAASGADLPPGVLNVIYGPGHPSGSELVSHVGIDAVSFTGGTETGRLIMAAAAKTLKRLGLELGGRSATIVFADADLEAALDGIILSIFANNGEFCAAGSRILIAEELYANFAAALADRANRLRIGPPLDHQTEIGPLVSARHHQWVSGCIQSGIAEGARLVAGGIRPQALPAGHYILPTVFADVHNRMTIAQQEVFGPVATMMSFDGSEATAVQLANDSCYGLASYVWSRASDKALRVARQLRAGVIAINGPLARDHRTPFGGFKASGLGRTGGRYSLELFTELKTTSMPIDPFRFPRWALARHN